MSSFRVFISSTFKNFEFERNYLAQNLYTPLDVACRRKGYAFHAIDLRWGISTEASLDNKSMLLCLDEIKKCQETNIKPNFLIMLGDYYGWKPLPFTIEEVEVEQLFTVLPYESKQLFLRCYKLDTNSIPQAYVLQGRQGELVDDAAWGKIETQLHDALETAAKTVLSADKLDKYIYSATHQEIIQGFLKDDIIKDFTFVFVKEEGNVYGNEKDYEHARKLKEKVLATLPETQYAVYKNEEEFSLAVKKAEEFLERTIAEQTQLLADTDKQILFLERLKDNYIPNQQLEDEIINSIENPAGKKIFVTADKYAGKTSLFLNIFYKLKSSKKQKIYLWCANSDHEHLSVLDLCQFLIKKSTRGHQNPYIEYDNACYFVQKVLCDQEDEDNRYVFLIDGIEDLFDFNKIKETFYNIVLPNNVVFVLSASTGREFKGSLQFMIQPFSCEKKQELFNSILVDCNRTITENQRVAMLSMINSGNPLLIRFLANKAAKTHSYDEIDGNIESIDAFIQKEIQQLSTPTMYGEMLISRIMIFLAFSPYGISEMELLGLLKRDDDVVKFLKSTANWDFDEQVGIPKVVLYRIMADIRAYVMELNDKGNIIYKFNSQYLSNVICEIYDTEIVNRLYALYKDYFKKRNVYINSKKDIDPRIARQWLYITTKEECELLDGLESVAFCDACIKLGEINYLLNGFKRMNLTDSIFYKTIMKYLGQLLVFRDMFLTYATTENIAELNNYKKIYISYGDSSTQKITNWMNDKLEFCHMLSDDTYVISCENSLLKLYRHSNEVVDKISFNAQVVKCCLSTTSNELLVVCANAGGENSMLSMQLIDLSQWSVLGRAEHNLSIPGYLYESNIQVFPYNNDFVVMASSFDSSTTTIRSNIYHLSGASCSQMCSIETMCTVAPVSEKYLLFKVGSGELRLFDLEQKQFVYSKKSLKYWQIDLNNSVVAEDGMTYCVVEANGVFRLTVEHGKLTTRKVFSLVPTTSMQNSNLWLLKKCFIIKQGGSSYADIYTYDGAYVGKFEWDGSTYIMEVMKDRVCCVDIGGKLFDMMLDTSIVFDQKKLQISLSEFWRAGGKIFKRLSNLFNKYEQLENTKPKCIISPDGIYSVRLTRDSIAVFEGPKLIFEYLYKSKNPDARDVCFIANHIVIWKQSYKEFKIIDIDNHIVKTLLVSSKKMHGYVIIDDSLLVSRAGSLNLAKQSTEIINDAVTKVKVSNSKEFSKEGLGMDINCFEPLEIVKTLRKRKEAKIIFSCSVPSQLQFNDLENDQILCLSNEYMVRLFNHKLFFYSYVGGEHLKTAYAFERSTNPDKSKMSVFQDVYYCYLEPLRTILMYNESAKQVMKYLLDDSVCDVSFDKNNVRLLHDNGSVDTICVQ